MIDLLRRRHSVRKYSKEKIDPEKIEILKEALLRAPSSRNRQPWSFAFVEDKKLLKKLAKAKPSGGTFIAKASLAVVIAGDERISDAWIEDCSIAATLLQLTAVSLELGSCWVQVRMRPRTASETAEQYVQKLLGFEVHMRVECIIAIGHPAESKPSVPDSELKKENIEDF